MAERSEADRRKYHRIATDQVISFAEAKNDDQLAVSRDVSIGGIRFETVGCDIQLGEVLRVTFNLGDHTIVAIGRVAWATDIDPSKNSKPMDTIDRVTLLLMSGSFLKMLLSAVLETATNRHGSERL